MQAYLASGEADQLAKIEPLYAEMTSGSGPAGRPLQFSANDFERLIKAAHRYRLAAVVRRWAARAKAVGLWKVVSYRSRRIVVTAAEWERQPRAPLDSFADAEPSQRQ